MIARVYQAVNAIAAALSRDGVAKTRVNGRDNYLYRSIDDVLERLAPLIAQHRLCILPRVLEREATVHTDDTGAYLRLVSLKVAFDLVSAKDGSCHTVEAYGEALDAGDKATPKAMQSAYKYAMLQTFCVPAAQGEDADAGSYRLKPGTLAGEPDVGWERWASNLTEAVLACDTIEAIHSVQKADRDVLTALGRERPALYATLGYAVANRKRRIASESAEKGEKMPIASLEARSAGKRAHPSPNRSNGNRCPSPRPALTPSGGASLLNGSGANA